MTESEAIKICNTVGFATSFSNPQGIPLNTTKEELTEAIRMSIQALEKQIPVKAVISGHNNAINTDVGCCPVCNHLPIRACDHNYCPNCGQKLNWESDEE